MKEEIIIHSPYRKYNESNERWEWIVEVFHSHLEKHNFSSREDAEIFIRKGRKV